jgi:hypothetical protein
VLGGSGPRIVRRSDPEPTDAEMEALFRCLRRVQPVLLGGSPLEPRYRVATDPLLEIRGVVAFLPTAGLPAGENVLVIPAVRRPDRTEEPDSFYIPFWVAR